MRDSAEDNDRILRIQKREDEQLQILRICESLAPVTTRIELEIAINTVIKAILGFNWLMVYIEDAAEKTYRLSFHNNAEVFNRWKNEYPDSNSQPFIAAWDSAEPLLLSVNDTGKTDAFPGFVTEAFQGSTSKILCCSMPSKSCKGVILFGYDSNHPQHTSDQYRIKMIAQQLAITFTNLLLFEAAISTVSKANIHSATTTTDDAGDSTGNDGMKMIGSSESIGKVRELITLVSKTDTGVLISGESGTGKELVAKAIHEHSLRKDKLFININCGAIPKNLIESELFGHERGSFTGATSLKKGKFELAHEGTLFLDEVGEMPLELQVKLLRVLQEKEIQRIGSSKAIKVNTRIIAATNRDLEKMVSEGNFRADLYYRLKIFPIDVPALRDRDEDIVALSRFFIKAISEKNNQPPKTISTKAINTLKAHHWPGNIRELEHVITRSFLLSPGKIIKDIHLGNRKEIALTGTNATLRPWKEFETEYLLSVLRFCKGKISGPGSAAAILEIPSTTLKSKMVKLGIKRRHYIM